MNISVPFIRRPVATTLLTIAVAVAGLIAFAVLPVAPLPQIDFPTIAITAALPGASAEIMAASVATPLERQLGHIAGITEMTSQSALGNTTLIVQFDLNRNIDGAARDVEAAINAARTYLPANLPSNPTYRKVNPSDAPILVLGLTSDKYDNATLYDLASTVLQQKLSQIQGVGQVVVGGAANPSVRVEANPAQLESYGLTLGSIKNILSLQNSHEPRGQISNGAVTADILTNDQISHADEYKPLVVGYYNGSAVHLSDVAEVVDSTQNLRTVGYLDGKRSVALILFRQPGANIIDTVDRVRAQMPFLEASMPKGVKTIVVLDRTVTIRSSVHDVESSLLGAIGLVVLVVFLFLRSGRATLIPGIAVPVSLMGTFAVMYLLGYSLDNLSLMALTISTGFVVDDAIVVMENITRHIEEGMTPLDAAIKGAQEIGFTVLSISASLVAVFVPILLMGGLVGRLFREFAVTLATSILVSMVVSLTTTPAMCAYLLRGPHSGNRQPWLYRVTERAFDNLLDLYRRSLAVALRHSGITLTVFALTLLANLVLLARVPKGFFPNEDTGAILGGVQGPQDASFPLMDHSLLTLGNAIKRDPAIDHVFAYTGGTGASNAGALYVALKPLAERRHSNAFQIIDRLRPKLDAMPVASSYLQAIQDLRVGGRAANAQYQYTITAENMDDLSRWGPVLLEHMKKLPGFEDVSSDQQNSGLVEQLDYDRTTAARVGQTTQSLDQSLYAAFGQSQVSVIYKPLNQYYVVLEAAPKFWQDPSGLDSLYLKSGSTSSGSSSSSSRATAGASSMLPFSTVATAHAATTPLEVNHTGVFPSVTVSFNLAKGMSLGDASKAIDRMESQLNMPASMHGAFAGTMGAFKSSLSSEPMLILAAIFAVYIVLGILYEDLIHPLTILSTLPSASVGAVLALLVFGSELDIISLIGIILLIGIVKKNAIMMVDFALLAERDQGMQPREAIFEACLLRFRPILMTTLAAIVGALPLAFGTGMGYELRRPLGIAIVGGLLLSQLLTLYTTPVIYLAFDRLRSRRRGALPRLLAPRADGAAS
ncbi:efflux RND transporter permease subunit [Silvibacterium acidisoli]|uniref:efflux RND transporter permease subunit n=1 Tax=Acidobacteriaceae bacterium ZG23-2 TaxID=2883246 RepID=UPI00406C0949